jgi:hypothetical protein
MRRSALAILLSLVCVSCAPQASRPATASLSADDVLRSYAQRVHAELHPHARDLNTEQMSQLVAAIAAEALVPHKDLLFAKAQAELAELPQFDADLTSGWETVADVQGRVIHNQMVAEIDALATRPDDLHSSTAMQTVNKDAIFLLLGYWDAKQTASHLRRNLVARHAGPEEFARLAMIGSLAPPLFHAVNADPQAPVIAIQTGPDVVVVSLRHCDKGYYIPEQVRWLRHRQAAAPQSNASTSGP